MVAYFLKRPWLAKGKTLETADPGLRNLHQSLGSTEAHRLW